MNYKYFHTRLHESLVNFLTIFAGFNIESKPDNCSRVCFFTFMITCFHMVSLGNMESGGSLIFMTILVLLGQAVFCDKSSPGGDLVCVCVWFLWVCVCVAGGGGRGGGGWGVGGWGVVGGGVGVGGWGGGWLGGGWGGGGGGGGGWF